MANKWRFLLRNHGVSGSDQNDGICLCTSRRPVFSSSLHGSPLVVINLPERRGPFFSGRGTGRVSRLEKCAAEAEPRVFPMRPRRFPMNEWVFLGWHAEKAGALKRVPSKGCPHDSWGWQVLASPTIWLLERGVGSHF